MNAKQERNWWIDLALYAGFIATFFLNLTGVEVHQWIGVLCGALATYHLFLHLDWVEAVSKRFLGKTSGQARMYYALDALLLLGFALVGVSGLVISTWLNLRLSGFTTWLNFHITASIATLVTLLLKLALHWRWIARATRGIWTKPAKAPVRNAFDRPARVGSSRMGRREFLRVMGTLGAASFVALINASQSLADTVNTAEAATNEAANTETISNPVNGSGQAISSSSGGSNCTVRCQRACSYPGHCHSYVDANNNNRCDLGECS